MDKMVKMASVLPAGPEMSRIDLVALDGHLFSNNRQITGLNRKCLPVKFIQRRGGPWALMYSHPLASVSIFNSHPHTPPRPSPSGEEQ